MNPEKFLSILKTRRSIRKFLPDAVPKGDIDKIITAASWAPSGANSQNWEFVVITSRAVKDKMKGSIDSELSEICESIKLSDAKNIFKTYAANFTFFNEAPVVIAVVQKPYISITRKIMKRYKIAGSATSAGVQGPSAAVENLILMAHVLGYGTCWMTGPLIAKERLEKILNINLPDELMAIVPVGRPAQEPRNPPRKKAAEITRYF